MKKMITAAFSLLLALYTFSSTAATLLPSKLHRDVNFKKITINHPAVPGVSPTTGLPKENDVYLPILSQIDNNLGAIPQWGISFADIMYELPIQGQGWTRLTALFSDQYPQEAGPVRSGRVMHADLREEWDAVIAFYGMQEAPGSNMKEALSSYGVNKKGLAIDGIGNKYQDYFMRVRYHAAPHNVSSFIDRLHDLILTQGYQFPVRPFLFTDESAYNGIEAKQFSIIHKGNKDSSSTFIFDESRNGYQRFTQQGAYYDYLNPTAILTYSNVIVQRTKLSFNNSSMNPLLPDIVGGGAADIFLSGQYIPGMWTRDNIHSRTVFYDQNGSELQLQRGKTWIVICDESTDLAIGDIDSSLQSNIFITVSEDENGRKLAEGSQSTISGISSETKIESDTVTAAVDSAKENMIVIPDSPNENAIVSPDPTNENALKEIATVRVNNNGTLNMRKSDTVKSEIVLRIPNGSQVKVIEKGKEWTRINFEDKDGYVMTKYLEF